MVLHFENNSPFLTIRSLVREVEISHWGNLAVEETYSLEHTGAKFTGAFSRFDYQRQGAPSSFHIMTHHLPAEAQDIYYRDEIGNVSSSFVSHPKEDYTKLEILPRYIMFGGWKISFYMGYNLPLSKYLSYDANHPSRYILNVTFAKTFEEPVSIDEIVVRIIFPEGASDIQYRVPFEVDSQDHDKHFTYLDTVGRPVLILQKNNIVGAHNQYFQVTYSFSKFTMLREPFLLIAAFFIFFFIVMIYVRLDLSITPDTVGIESSKQKQLRDCLQRVNEIQKAREEIYAELDSTAARSKAKNPAQFASEKKTLDDRLKNLSVTNLKQLAEIDINTANKVRDLDRLEAQRAAYQHQIHELDIRKRNNDIQKPAYDESKAAKVLLYNRTKEEIEQIISDLSEDL